MLKIIQLILCSNHHFKGNVWRTNTVPYNDKMRKKKKYRNVDNNDNGLPYKMKIVHATRSEVLDEQFNRLCRGEELLKPSDKIGLMCFQFHHEDPYLKLGPFKLDNQNMAPYITVFRDFFSDKEMDYYKDFSRDNLERSTYGSAKSYDKDQHSAGVLRTSKQTWLSEFDQSVFGTGNNSKFGIGPYMTRENLDKCTRDNVAMHVSDRQIG